MLYVGCISRFDSCNDRYEIRTEPFFANDNEQAAEIVSEWEEYNYSDIDAHICLYAPTEHETDMDELNDIFEYLEYEFLLGSSFHYMVNEGYSFKEYDVVVVNR